MSIARAPRVNSDPRTGEIIQYMLRSTCTVLLLNPEAARSSLPSPFQSPTATDDGLANPPTLPAAPRAPPPCPSRIDTLFEPWLLTARSSLPSPLKSPQSTPDGLPPTA